MYSILVIVVLGIVVILGFLVYDLYEQLSKIRSSILNGNVNAETMQTLIDKVSKEIEMLASKVLQTEKRIHVFEKVKPKNPSVTRKIKKRGE